MIWGNIMKKIIIIVAAVLAVVACVAVVFFAINKTSDNVSAGNNEENTSQAELSFVDKLFNISNVSEYEEFVKDIELENSINEENTIASILNVEFLYSEHSTATFEFDVSGNVNVTHIYVNLYEFYTSVELSSENEVVELEELTAEEIKHGILAMLRVWCESFGCTLPDNVYIFTFDGKVVNINDEGAVDILKQESSFLRFAIRDSEGYYWETDIRESNGTYKATVTKYFDRETTAGYYANISLSGTFGEPVEITEYPEESESLAEDINFEEADETSADEVIEEALEEITEDLTETETE